MIVALIKLSFSEGDFKIFLGAAELLAAGKSPYHQWINVNENNFGLYYYSPFWAMILIPFSLVPQFITNLIWLSLNVFFIIRIKDFLTEYIKPFNFSQKQLNIILLATFLMSVRFIFYNFGMIQMTIFLLWGILESLNLTRQKKYFLSGALLALVINIKLLPLVVIPYLLYRKEFHTTLYVVIFSVCFIFIPALVLGWSENIYFHSEWWSVINPANPEHLHEVELGPHSLTALIPTLLISSEGHLPYARNIVDLDSGSVAVILNAVRLSLIILTIYFLKWPPFIRARDDMENIREISYILLLVPLIFPHQQKYSFLMALPAQFYLASFLVMLYPGHKNILSRFKWGTVLFCVTLSFVLMTMTTDGVVGRELNRVSQHYKAITYGALLLIIPLMICSGKYFNEIRGKVIKN